MPPASSIGRLGYNEQQQDSNRFMAIIQPVPGVRKLMICRWQQRVRIRDKTLLSTSFPYTNL